MEIECYHCRKTEAETVIVICRVCHRRFCEDHAVRRGGVDFCSLGCGMYFFHSEPEDEEE
jgi:hypothetical protein